MAGDNDSGRSHQGRPRSYVFVSTTEAFTVSRDEDTEGEECGVSSPRVSGIGKEILGNAHLGEGILRKYSRAERRSYQGIRTKAARRRG